MGGGTKNQLFRQQRCNGVKVRGKGRGGRRKGKKKGKEKGTIRCKAIKEAIAPPCPFPTLNTRPTQSTCDACVLAMMRTILEILRDAPRHDTAPRLRILAPTHAHAATHADASSHARSPRARKRACIAHAHSMHRVSHAPGSLACTSLTHARTQPRTSACAVRGLGEQAEEGERVQAELKRGQLTRGRRQLRAVRHCPLQSGG